MIGPGRPTAGRRLPAAPSSRPRASPSRPAPSGTTKVNQSGSWVRARRAQHPPAATAVRPCLADATLATRRPSPFGVGVVRQHVHRHRQVLRRCRIVVVGDRGAVQDDAEVGAGAALRHHADVWSTAARRRRSRRPRGVAAQRSRGSGTGVADNRPIPVMTPSTTARIWISSAGCPSPTMQAPKSNPPRPCVDGVAVRRPGDEAAHHRYPPHLRVRPNDARQALVRGHEPRGRLGESVVGDQHVARTSTCIASRPGLPSVPREVNRLSHRLSTEPLGPSTTAILPMNTGGSS